MKKEASFLNEFTIGLSLAPIAMQMLSGEYLDIIPVFPWKSRECSNISKVIHSKDKFKVFGIYPRRPKLNLEYPEIRIKINKGIIAGALEGERLGMPIFASCPIVKSFWELNQNMRVIWMFIKYNSNEDSYITVSGNNVDCINDSIVFVEKKEDFCRYINNYSQVQTIESAFNAFKSINEQCAGRSSSTFFGFRGIYKPIYFLIKVH